MARYWVYIDSRIQGPVDIPTMRKLPGFNLLAQVCQEGEKSWRLADEVIEIKSYFLAPPRISSLSIPVGNTVPQPETLPDPNPQKAPLTVLEPDTSFLEELPAITPADKSAGKIDLPKDDKKVPANAAAAAAAGTPPASGKAAGGLRALCDVCGYKNPRDVNACMKCGSPITGGSGTEVLDDTPVPAKMPVPVATATPAPASAEEVLAKLQKSIQEESLAAADNTPPPTPAVAVPRIVWVILGITILVVGSFLGYRAWNKKKKVAKAAKQAEQMLPVTPSDKTKDSSSSRRRRSSGSATPSPIAHTLPGVSASAPASASAAAPERHSVRSMEAASRAVPATPVAKAPMEESADDAASDTDDKPRAANSENPGYRVIAEATPLKQRQSSPIDSVYATKRRADKTLWTAQQEQAMRQVQRTRIYGGQRTIQRNAEILIQILRDREYSTAFDTGKRLHFYNDLDWSATLKDGPIYEVKLAFSGGREDDGSPRRPLRFAFTTDLERRTVEPSSSEEGMRANTLHAFFDESRIPPEERRPIAKDVEELVLAADPSGSPLALDTVMRAFANTYSIAAMERVANAFGLENVKKKIKNDPDIGKGGGGVSLNRDGSMDMPMQKVNKPVPSMESASAPMTSAVRQTPMEFDVPAKRRGKVSTEDGMDFRMDRGNGRDRTILARVKTKASADRLWEALTSYERFKQFIPDVLTSEREGQDGPATIVHMVSLSRWMMFVFKINLHLRILERPQQRIVEFERIAGDFESFRGSFEVQTDPVTKQAAIVFRGALTPKGKTPAWVLHDMAKRFILPKLDAIRSRAEAN